MERTKNFDKLNLVVRVEPERGKRMSIFSVETYVVRPEKRPEFDPALKEFLKYKETHQELFKGVRSWKLFKQEYGGVSGLYIEMWEFDSLGDMEAITARIFSDEAMKRISRGFHQLIEATSFSNYIWHPGCLG
jgi:hypothetical protein